MTLDGVERVADAGFFASIDDARDQAWFTLRGAFTGGHDLLVQ